LAGGGWRLAVLSGDADDEGALGGLDDVVGDGVEVHGVPRGDQPTGEVDDARMQAGDLVEHENRRP